MALVALAHVTSRPRASSPSQSCHQGNTRLGHVNWGPLGVLTPRKLQPSPPRVLSTAGMGDPRIPGGHAGDKALTHQIPTLGLNLGAAPGRCRSRLRLAPPLPHTSGLSWSEAAAEGWMRGDRTDRQTDGDSSSGSQESSGGRTGCCCRERLFLGELLKILKLIKRLKCSHASNSFGAFLEEISVSSVRLSVPRSWEGSHPKALLCAVQRCSRSSLAGLALPWGPQTPLCFAAPSPAPWGALSSAPHPSSPTAAPAQCTMMSPRTRTHTGTTVGTACVCPTPGAARRPPSLSENQRCPNH